MKTTDEIIDEIVESAMDNKHEEFVHAANRLRSLCESPIEEVLCVALQHILKNSSLLGLRDSVVEGYVNFYGPDSSIDLFEGGGEIWTGLHVYVQGRVGKYRADFVCVLNTKSDRYIIVIECDGHNFHERTKQQAKRDRSRDRWMGRNGITVVRFTGSEIWGDPIGCAAEVDDALCRVAGYEQGDGDG